MLRECLGVTGAAEPKAMLARGHSAANATNVPHGYEWSVEAHRILVRKRVTQLARF